MRVKKLYPILLAAVVALASCQKEVKIDLGDDIDNPGNVNPEPGTAGRSIEGNWKFVKMLLTINSVMEMPVSGINSRFVISANAPSEAEGGTLAIGATDMKTTGITYSINSTASVQMFAAGIPVGTEQLPVNVEQPPAGNEVTYTRIGNDSLRTSAPLIDVEIEGFEDFQMPIGGRIGWSKDTLILTSLVNEQYTDNSTGQTIKVMMNGKQVLKFVKQ
jgi:hypothetical protein